MKKHLLILFATLLSLVASAQTKVEIDGIWYNLVSETQQAEVTFKGSSYYEYKDEYSGSITIPTTVTYGGVEYSVTSIGEWAFGYSSMTTITIPKSVTSIGSSAFCGCKSLTAINIPESVTSIGNGAFERCSNLQSVTIPEGVTSIGNLTFIYCTSLTTITIPEEVISIGAAFTGCSSLTDITCKAIIPPTINFLTFDKVDKSIPVYVPEGSVEAYKTASYWSEFTNFIGMGTTGIDNSQFTIDNGKFTIHDLQGRKVTDTEDLKGIYIIDGRKVIIK